MSVVKSLTNHGITVCATIHSPTPYCFNLFDRVLLLLRGQVAFFGPNGARPAPPPPHAPGSGLGVSLLAPSLRETVPCVGQCSPATKI